MRAQQPSSASDLSLLPISNSHSWIPLPQLNQSRRGRVKRQGEVVEESEVNKAGTTLFAEGRINQYNHGIKTRAQEMID